MPTPMPTKGFMFVLFISSIKIHMSICKMYFLQRDYLFMFKRWSHYWFQKLNVVHTFQKIVQLYTFFHFVQGKGKSTVIRTLAPNYGNTFCDTIIPTTVSTFKESKVKIEGVRLLRFFIFYQNSKVIILTWNF